MPRVRQSVVVSLVVAVCMGATGCQQQAGTVEDEKLEHVSAPHRPADYAAAVLQIDARNPFRATTTNDSDSLPPISELSDIVVWMPEIAADSDLKKAEWDEVASIAAELEALITKPKTDAAAAQRYAAIIVRLREFVALSETWKSPAALSTPLPAQTPPPAAKDDAAQTNTPDQIPSR